MSEKTDIELISTDDLVEEIQKRCLTSVILLEMADKTSDYTLPHFMYTGGRHSAIGMARIFIEAELSDAVSAFNDFEIELDIDDEEEEI